MDIKGVPQHVADRITLDKRTGCWEWSGDSGKVTLPGTRRAVLVKAIVFEAVTGEKKPYRVCLWRNCETPWCVNPDHHTLGYRVKAETCGRGHSLHDAYLDVGGGRTCRTCQKNRQRGYRAQVKAETGRTKRKRVSSAKGAKGE